MTVKNESSNSYKWYVLALLTFVYALNFFDRQLIVILQESIKKELNLSDTQLGMLSGLAFAIFYSVLGIPIARFADKSNRKNIVAVSLAVWSFMTAITGYARNFYQLLLMRIGVGVGEAGGTPPSHSIISDYFPIEKRATALAIYATGLYFGWIFGFLLGGWLDEEVGWRNAFMLLGFPGILVSLILFFTVKEPKRGLSEKTIQTEKQHSLSEVISLLLSKKTFVCIAIAQALHTFVGYGFGNWMPPFFARVHGMNSMEIGFWLAFSVGVGGAIGAFLGGFLADRLALRDRKWYMLLIAYSIVFSVPFSLITVFSDAKMVSILCYFIPNVLYAVSMGPTITVLHGIVPVNMRTITSAIFFFIINLIGLGLGPMVVGALSDALKPQFGNESLRYALYAISTFDLIALYYFYKASKTVAKEMLV